MSLKNIGHKLSETNLRNFKAYLRKKLKTCLRNKIKAFKGGWISSKIEEWENITLDKEILKTIEILRLDFEQELLSQKTKMMSGQAS